VDLISAIPVEVVVLLVIAGFVSGLLMLYSVLAISGRISREEEREELRRLMHLEDEVEMLDETEEE
jgi:hypothetical protein